MFNFEIFLQTFSSLVKNLAQAATTTLYNGNARLFKLITFLGGYLHCNFVHNSKKNSSNSNLEQFIDGENLDKRHAMAVINIKHEAFFIIIIFITCAVPILRMNLLNKQHTHINKVKYVEKLCNSKVECCSVCVFYVIPRVQKEDEKENKKTNDFNAEGKVKEGNRKQNMKMKKKS